MEPSARCMSCGSSPHDESGTVERACAGNGCCPAAPAAPAATEALEGFLRDGPEYVLRASEMARG